VGFCDEGVKDLGGGCLPYLLSFPPGRERRSAGRSNRDGINYPFKSIEKHHKLVRTKQSTTKKLVDDFILLF
jgi:hypothetical protein